MYISGTTAFLAYEIKELSHIVRIRKVFRDDCFLITKGKKQTHSLLRKPRNLVSFSSKAIMREHAAVKDNKNKTNELLMNFNLKVCIGVKKYDSKIPQSLFQSFP